MVNFDLAHKFTSRSEGGYVDNPKDPGGATNLGISFRFLRSIGMDIDGDGDIDINDIKQLTPEIASKVYYDHFWKPIHGDALPQLTAICQYDAAVNVGISQASKILQSTCNFYPGEQLIVDGACGPKTIQRVNSLCGNKDKDFTFAVRMLRFRRDFYSNLVDRKPDLDVFYNGWINRVVALQKYIQGLM